MGVRSRKRVTLLVATVIVLCSAQFAGAQSRSTDDPTPTHEWGALVFEERCVLCHGSYGDGDGPLPAIMKEYPDTNLHRPDIQAGEENIKTAIIWGGSKGDMSSLAPPWGDELTWSEIESVVMFTRLLHDDNAAARAMLVNQKASPIDVVGREIFESRCVLCHGQYGEGDGRMAKVINDPPPFNLTLSAVPEDYAREIILEGGEAVGRSGHMPPWKDELNDRELDAIIDFILSLRKYGGATTSN